MRLLDMLRTEAPRPCFGDKPFPVPDWLWKKETEVFEITEVAEFVLGLSKDGIKVRATEGTEFTDPLTGDRLVGTNLLEGFGIAPGEIVTIRPPFDQMWMEFQAPDWVQVKAQRGKASTIGKCGVVLDWIDASEDARDKYSIMPKMMRGLRHQYGQVGCTIDYDRVKSVLVMAAFMHKPGQGIMGPMGLWLLPADENGQTLIIRRDPDITPTPRQESLAATIEGDPAWLIIPPKSEYAHDDWLVGAFATQSAGVVNIPALVALGILHTRQDAEKTWTTEKVVPEGKVRVRKGVLEPMVTYKVLKIGPLRARMAEEGHKTVGQVLLALHRVRGHYKHYRRSFHGSTTHPRNGQPLSQDNPFIVWCPDFERGSAKAGRTEKDYTVTTPKERS